MPATTDYWVNDANAAPLLVITAPANEGLLAMMEQEWLPQIRTLAGDARRVTLIFDREGWSPKTFRTWTMAGLDVITYRKGRYRDWQRRCFTEVTVDLAGRTVPYLLAERVVHGSKGFRMREVRRLCDNGHQTAVVTTRRDLSIETVGAADVRPLATGERLPLPAARVRPGSSADHGGGAGGSSAERAQSRREGEAARAGSGHGAAREGRTGVRATGSRQPRAAASHGARLQDLPGGAGTDDHEAALGPRANWQQRSRRSPPACRCGRR